MTQAPAWHTVLIVPALQRLQREYGYLQPEALRRYSKESGIPLYRLHAVASFFPHFQLTPPPPVTVRVCRDMACHLAGSAEILRELEAGAGEHCAVQGVSCLGRCDRPPAACVAVRGRDHEAYFLGRSAAALQEIIALTAAENSPPPDEDEALPLPGPAWRIDPDPGAAPAYLAARQVLAARDASLQAAVQLLRTERGWGTGEAEEFRLAALNGSSAPPPERPEVEAAVRAWQTETDWAAQPALGGWADALLAELTAAELRGLGGAGIPAARKWRDVREAVRRARGRRTDERAFIVVNGDESEPGTFKDRELLLRVPHLIVEAVIIAGLITEATEGFIYIRHEYPEQIAACRAEIRRAEALGLCGAAATALGRPFLVSVFISPGGYICGEQSALLEAMSDRRGEPRNMPPSLETNGLEDLPTLVSNVETYAWVPFILRRGGAAYAAEGVNTWKGRRFFSVSGDVQRPGVYEVPIGLTLRELICGEAFAQGIAGDLPLKAIAPSGPSGGFLSAQLTAPQGLAARYLKSAGWPAFAARHGLPETATAVDLLDLELELNLFRELSPTAALGAGIIVYAEGRDMAREAVNSLAFFRRESCGKCVPCRIGSQKLAALGENLLEGRIEAERWESEILPLVEEMGEAVALASICGLGRSVPMPLRTVVSLFPQDIAAHLAGPTPVS